MREKAIVIGSGVGGMAAAIRLSVMGFEVDVFEKNPYPGGKLSSFEQAGFSFDAGPSLFTSPHYIEELFALAGEPVQSYFTYSKLPVTCHYFFENGKTLKAPAAPADLATAMEQAFGESGEAVNTYLHSAQKLYRNVGALFLENSLHRWKTFLKPGIFRAIGTSRFGYLFNSLHLLNSSRLKTPEAIQLFNRYATYNGSNPYKAPGMLSLIPHLEMNEGSFYPAGGMISITKALYHLAMKKGARFHFNMPVESISVEDNAVSGIVANGSKMAAHLVVSNADIYFTYNKLLDNKVAATKVLKQERSSSALIFYWGIGKSFPQLQLHNIFFSADYEKEFQHLFTEKTLSGDPTVYINITSKMENGHAPEGKENWFVMINAPADYGQDWELFKNQARKAVISKLNRLLDTDLEKLIECESILDPVLIQAKTASYMGSLYGTSSNSKLAAFFRHPNFSRKTGGLYFVGGSVHPGGGIPLCLQSAKIMCDLVKDDFKITGR